METVVEGALNEGDEGTLNTGDGLWTTAGRGIIHGERAIPLGRTGILQVWFALPEKDRWIEPSFEVTRHADAALRSEAGVEAREYGGSSGGAHAERDQHVPITLVDIRLDAGASFDPDSPASYNGFLYVLDGALRAGDALLRAGQVGCWIARMVRA